MKFIFGAALAALLFVPARAEDKPAPAAAAAPAAKAKSSWGDFFKNLKNSLGSSAVTTERKKGHGATSVSAVRGGDQGKKSMADLNEPGIKGDSKAARAAKELGWDKKIEDAVDLVTKGDLDGGLKGLEEFKVLHKAYKADDVDKAIEGVKAMQAEKKAGVAPADTASTPVEKP